MRTIWKYPLARRGWNPLLIGKDAKILLAALDHTTRAPTLWVELKRPDQSLRGIDKAETMMMNMDDIREFRVAVTDDDVEEGETHVGRSAERREGKECVSTFESRGSRDTLKTKHQQN